MDETLRQSERDAANGDPEAIAKLEHQLNRLAYTGDVPAALQLQELLLQQGEEARPRLDKLRDYLLGREHKPTLWEPEKPASEYTDDELVETPLFVKIRESCSYNFGGETRYLSDSDILDIVRPMLDELWAVISVMRECKLVHSDSEGWHWVHPSGGNIEGLIEAAQGLIEAARPNME